MSRREFLGLIAASTAGGLLASCHVRTRPRRPTQIRAVAFDLFTLFDPRSIERVAEQVAPGTGPALARAWRARQFEYGFIRAAAGQYADFRTVTRDALDVAAHGFTLDATARERLVSAYEQLDLWPDALAVLTRLRGAGLRLAPLANYAPTMLRALLEHGRITHLFDHQISTAAARTFKPAPRAYQLGVDVLGLPRDEIAFAAFGGWDAAGATWFGYPTFWVNRLGLPTDKLVALEASGPDLASLERWLSSRAATSRTSR